MIRRAFMVSIIAFATFPALAAPFCIAGPGLPPQCLYDDLITCERATEPPNTSCVVSPDAVLSYVGGANNCLVSSSRIAQCIYADRDQCNGEAGRSGGICISRSDMAGDRNDPYRFDPRIQDQGGQTGNYDAEEGPEMTRR